MTTELDEPTPLAKLDVFDDQDDDDDLRGVFYGDTLRIYPRPGELARLVQYAMAEGIRLHAPIPRSLVTRGYAGQPWFDAFARLLGVSWEARENAAPHLCDYRYMVSGSVHERLGLTPYPSPVLGGVRASTGSGDPRFMVSPHVPYLTIDVAGAALWLAPLWLKTDAILALDLETRIGLAERASRLLADPTRHEAVSALLRVTDGKALAEAVAALEALPQGTP